MGDGTNTIYNLLEGKYIDEEIDHRYKKLDTCQPFYMVTFGVDMDLKDNVPIRNIIFKDPIKYGEENKEIINMINVRTMNYGDFAPKGKSIGTY